jgi:N-acetyl-gamma-glutamyl-phosphate reductase
MVNAAVVEEEQHAATAATGVAKTDVAIVGATGYAGAELTAILHRHPHAQLTALYSGTGGGTTPFASIHPSLAHARSPLAAQPFDAEGVMAAQAEVVFLATPNEVSNEVVPRLLDAGKRVVDLSGAYRLQEAALYPSWYGFASARPALLTEAVYGLTELCSGELKTARLVANPGCYPTSILLALRPLAFLIDREQAVICNSASGVSGAGKKSDLAFSFSELFGNFKPYGVGQHRHEPEIRQGLRLGDRASVVFVPHLLPVARGIVSTIHVAFTHAVTEAELVNIYADAFRKAPLVTVLPPGRLPELKSVVNTPRAEIGFQPLEGGRRAVIVSAIDNLLKGAASQAVQNFNRMCGYAETEGLV